jgi:hypothetical protein
MVLWPSDYRDMKQVDKESETLSFQTLGEKSCDSCDCSAREFEEPQGMKSCHWLKLATLYD